MWYEHTDREASGGGLLLAEPRLEGVGGVLGRDGGDGTRFGRRKYEFYLILLMYLLI